MNRLNTISKILFILLLFGYIFFIVIKSYNDKQNRESKTRYTIGTIIDVRSQSKGDPIIIYTIRFDNKEYKHYHSIYKYLINLKNKRFYFKFEKDNPENCEILLDKPVPDSIKKAPPNGSNKIP